MINLVQNFNINYINSSNFVKRILPHKKYDNLSPLKSDVVSFSGRAKLIAANMQDAPSGYTCRVTEENSEPARFYLNSVLEKYLGSFVSKSSDDKASEKPIARLYTRTKSASSIREKVVSKYSKLQREEVIKFSDQVFEELSQYFKINPDTNKETIISEKELLILKMEEENCLHIQIALII